MTLRTARQCATASGRKRPTAWSTSLTMARTELAHGIVRGGTLSKISQMQPGGNSTLTLVLHAQSIWRAVSRMLLLDKCPVPISEVWLNFSSLSDALPPPQKKKVKNERVDAVAHGSPYGKCLFLLASGITTPLCLQVVLRFLSWCGHVCDVELETVPVKSHCVRVGGGVISTPLQLAEDVLTGLRTS